MILAIVENLTFRCSLNQKLPVCITRYSIMRQPVYEQ